MRHYTRSLFVALTVVGLLAMGTPQASAASGKVLVFRMEFTEATVYDNPTKCTTIPLDSHILVNLTDAPIKVWPAGPIACPGFPAEPISVAPNYGGHVAPGASFSP